MIGSASFLWWIMYYFLSWPLFKSFVSLWFPGRFFLFAVTWVMLFIQEWSLLVYLFLLLNVCYLSSLWFLILLRVRLCAGCNSTTRSVGGRSRTFPATHAVCLGTPIGILEFTIPLVSIHWWRVYFILGLYSSLEITNTPSVSTVTRHRPYPYTWSDKCLDESRGLHWNFFLAHMSSLG